MFTVVAGTASIYSALHPDKQTYPSEVKSRLADVDALRHELEGEAGEKVDRAESYFKAGLHDFKQKRYREAAENCQKSIEALPSASAYLNLTAFLAYLSQCDKAEEVSGKGIQIAQTRSNGQAESSLLTNRAACYDQRGLVDKGVADLKRAVELNPNNGAAHFNLAAAYCNLSLHDQALEEVSRSIDLSEEDRDLEVKGAPEHNLRGVIKSNQGHYEEALSELNKAIQANEDFCPAYYHRGTVFVKRGKPGDQDLAMSDFQTAIRKDPRFSPAYVGRAIVWLARGEPDQAIADCSTALHLNPRGLDAYLARAKAYAQKGACTQKGLYVRAMSDINLALDTVNNATTDNKAITRSPLYAEALIIRGTVGACAGIELDAAEDDLNRALEIGTPSAEAHLNRGIVYLRKASYDKAASDFSTAIELKPNYAIAFHNRGLVFKQQHRNVEATNDFRTACSLGLREACEEYDGVTRTMKKYKRIKWDGSLYLTKVTENDTLNGAEDSKNSSTRACVPCSDPREQPSGCI